MRLEYDLLSFFWSVFKRYIHLHMKVFVILFYLYMLIVFIIDTEHLNYNSFWLNVNYFCDSSQNIGVVPYILLIEIQKDLLHTLHQTSFMFCFQKKITPVPVQLDLNYLHQTPVIVCYNVENLG